MSLPKTAKILKDFKPYIPGLKSKMNLSSGIILSSNENPFGTDKEVVAAIKQNLSSLHRYPYLQKEQLIEAIANKYNIAKDMLILTSGSSEALALLTKAYLNPLDEVIITEYAFLLYAIYAKFSSAKVVYAKDLNKKVCINNILDAINNKTKIIFLTNPNNPTGSYLNKNEIKELIKNIPSHIILVLDCAYQEYVMSKDYDCGMDYVRKHKNIIYIRTFSKIHGMASLRLGWTYADKTIIANLNELIPIYNVTQPAYIAGIQALSNDDHIIKCRNLNYNNKKWLITQLEKLRLLVYPSEGNFILVDFDSANRANYVYKNLQKQDIYIRIMVGYKLPTCLRITIGSKPELNQLVHALKKLLLNDKNE